MHVIILEAVAIVRDVLVALFDLVLLRRRGRYRHSLLVRAPRDMVWAVASARNITLDGTPPIVINALPSPEPGVEVLQIRSGDVTCRMGLRAIERREGVGEMNQLVPEYTDPMALASGLTHTGFGLLDVPNGTRLTMLQEGRRVPFGARINTPIALRLMGRRIAAASEQAAAMRPAARRRLRKTAAGGGRTAE